MIRFNRCLAGCMAAGVLAGCGDSPTDLAITPKGSPAFIQIVGGDGQAGVAGHPLDEPIQVRALNADTRPVDTDVRFAIEVGGGAFYTATGGPFTTVTVPTKDGVASVRWAPGPVANSPNRALVSIDGVPAPARFTATARPGPPAAIRAISPLFDSVPQGPSFSVKIRAQLVDRFGNPVPGATVTWTSGSSAGRVEADETVSAANGEVTNQWTVTPKTGPLSGVYWLSLGPWGRFVRVAGSPGLRATAVVAGDWHTCALDADGLAQCWGSGASGELGGGFAMDSPSPVPVQGGHRFTMLAAGGLHTCGLTAAGAVWCWGSNRSGQLGDPTQDYAYTPVQVVGNPPLQTIAAAGYHTCGLDREGAPWCWGSNVYGQLGTGDQISRRVATAAVTTARFVDLALAANHTCARTAAGAGYCWGGNWSKQVAAWGQFVLVPTSAEVTTGPLAAADNATCGMGSAGPPLCWGAGQGPHEPGTGRFTQMVGRAFRICGIGESGIVCQVTLQCDAYLEVCSDAWLPPESVRAPFRVASLGVGTSHLCVLAAVTSVVYCSGNDAFGQLGLGRVTDGQLAFQPVLMPGRP